MQFIYLGILFQEVIMMSYVDEVIDLVVKKNPAEPEFTRQSKKVTGIPAK